MRFLGTDITAPNVIADLNGSTYTVSSSTPSSPTTNDVWYDTTNKLTLVYNGSVWESYGGGSGGSDPALAGRVTALENTNVSGLRTFAEDFKTQNLVNLVATDASVGVGYVRTDKLALFAEDYSTTNNLDAPNSTNVAIDTVGKKLSLTSGNTSGLALSKAITTAGTVFATVNASVNHKSAMAFSAYTKQSSANLTQDHFSPCAIVDRANRTWYVWQVSGTAVTGGLWAKVIASDGSVLFNGFVVNFITQINNTTWNGTDVRLAVDFNNRVWILAMSYTGSQYPINHMIINPDFSTFKALTQIATASSFARGDIFVDRNSRAWIAYASGNVSTSQYTAFNSDGTLFFAATTLLSGNAPQRIRLIYDSTRDRIVAVQTTSTTNFMAAIAFSLAGTITVAQVNLLTSTVGNSLALSAVYAASSDKILVFGQNGTSRKVVLYTVNPATLALVSTTPIPETTLTTDTYISVLPRTSDYLVVYGSNADSASAVTLRLIGVSETGTVTVPESGINSAGDTAGNHYAVTLFADSAGNIKAIYQGLKYSTFNTIEEAAYITTSSTATFSLSNDNGATWTTATLGTQITFSASGTQLRVRINLTAPIAGSSPDIISYSLIEGNNTTNTGVTRTFYSSTLPSALPIAKAMVTATMDLSGGSTVAWFVSNDGGANWNAVTLGQLFTFSNAIGGDLRVKATLTYPITATSPPIITAYTVSSYNLVSISDITSLQINLIKTNFRVSVLQNAAKYALRNMVIDDYNSTSGVNAGLTTATYDSTNKLYNAGVIVSNADTTSFTPVKVLLSAEYTVGTGSVSFEISRNGGTNWTTVLPDQLTDISAQPTGTSLVSRTTLTGTATITSIGYSWG